MFIVFYSPPGTVYVLTVTVFSCRHSQCGCYSSYSVQYFPVLLVYKMWICCVPSGLDISIPSVLAVINLVIECCGGPCVDIIPDQLLRGVLRVILFCTLVIIPSVESASPM